MIAPLTRKAVPLGRVVATPAALDAIKQAGQSPLDFLQRHRQGDWGEVCGEDWEANDTSLQDGTRILSAYKTALKVKIWVITEADRSATTILLPDEY